MLCSHRWRVVSCDFTAPRSDLTKVNLVPGDAAQQDLTLSLLHGFTTITQSCTKCHKIRVTKTPGKVSLDARSDAAITLSPKKNAETSPGSLDTFTNFLWPRSPREKDE